MGTIAARDAQRRYKLTERVVSIHLADGRTGLRYKRQHRHKAASDQALEKIRFVIAPVLEDRPMDKDIESICAAIKYSDLFRTKK